MLTNLLASALKLEIVNGDDFERDVERELEKAQRRALVKSGERLLSLVRRGFREGGVNPQTGQPGFWPERKLPDIYQDEIERFLSRAKREGTDAWAARKKAVEKVRRERKKGVSAYAAWLKRADLSDSKHWAKGVRSEAEEKRRRLNVAREKRIRVGGRVLMDTGAYYDSISLGDIETDLNGTMQITVGTNIPYAKYHEQPWGGEETTQTATAKQATFLRGLGFSGVRVGSTITLPARRVFVMPEPWAKELSSIYEREMQRALNGA